MTAEEIKGRLLRTLSRDLVIDLFDVAVARARQAYELIRDNTDLKGRSARGLEGQARFRLMEKGFQDVCERHGGLRLDGDVIPGTDLRYYQPFMRFGGDGPGVLLGLASMSEPSKLPTKNQSRSAGVTLNYRLSPRLDLEGDSAIPKPGDVFVLLLFARDPAQAGQVEEVAFGVIDGNYLSFLFYESVEAFLTGFARPESAPEAEGESQLVRLKKTHKRFKPPEDPEAEDDAADAGE
jgi:hypothetical protein